MAAQPGIELSDLWFSYEVAEVIGGTAKAIDKDSKRLTDGGLSIDAPRKQHDQVPTRTSPR